MRTPTIASADLEAIGSLESGNRRTAQRVLGTGGTAQRVLGTGQVTDAYAGANLRTVARAMEFRTAGDHGRGWERVIDLPAQPPMRPDTEAP